MSIANYTVVDQTGDTIGFGIAHTREFPEAYVWSCNNEPWDGKDRAALPFRVAACEADGSPILD